MNRREVVALVAAAPLLLGQEAALAQTQGRTYRLGILALTELSVELTRKSGPPLALSPARSL